MKFYIISFISLVLSIGAFFIASDRAPASGDFSSFARPPPWLAFRFGPRVGRLLEQTSRNAMPPFFRGLRDASAFMQSAKAHAFAVLNVADAMSTEEPRTAQDIAARAVEPLHADTLFRFLRSVALDGYVEAVEQPDKSVKFRLTEFGALFASNLPQGDGLAASTRFLWQYVRRYWETLPEAIKSGKSRGALVWEELMRDESGTRDFTEFMAALMKQTGEVVPFEFDFGNVTTLVEAGGGTGQLTAAITRAYRNIKEAIVFDLPDVIAKAKHDRFPRVKFQSGNFFNESTIPKGADLYLIAGCLNDWSLEDAARILRNLRNSGGPKSHVMVLDPELAPDSPMYPMMTSQDLNMMLCCAGRMRTMNEMKDVIKAAGLKLVHSVPTRSMFRIYLMR